MSQKLFVGNLSFSVTNQDLKAKFEQHGEVESATIIINKDTRKSKGFGFVEMKNSSDAFEAIKILDGSEFDGRTISVSEAKPLVPNDPRLAK